MTNDIEEIRKRWSGNSCGLIGPAMTIAHINRLLEEVDNVTAERDEAITTRLALCAEITGVQQGAAQLRANLDEARAEVEQQKKRCARIALKVGAERDKYSTVLNDLVEQFDGMGDYDHLIAMCDARALLAGKESDDEEATPETTG